MTIKEMEVKARELRELQVLIDEAQAEAAGLVYPPDLHYLWEFMQEKNIGLPYCLVMIYNLYFTLVLTSFL